MTERLSYYEKKQIEDDIKNNIKPTSILLKKLSNEISKDFGNTENSGKYEESIKKLISLEEKVQNKDELSKLSDELKKLSSHLSEEKKKEFLFAIKGAKEILTNSKDLINDIKKNTNIFKSTDGTFTTKIFGQKTLNRAKNPKNIGDEIIGGTIGLFNSSEAIAKVSVKMLIGIGKTIPDLYKIINGKGEYDGFKNM